MKRRIALVVMVVGLVLPVLADSLSTADSLRDVQAPPLWEDSSLALTDTTASGPTGLIHGWVLPVGVILVTATAVWLLFSTRSR
jgi:hypothetical protein